MKRTLRYIFSLLLLSTPMMDVHAQKGTIMPSAVRVGTDLGYLGVSLFDPEKSQFEIVTDIDIYKMFLTVDYGMASWSFEEPGFIYDNSGSYLKIGMDYNFIARDPDLNVIYFGAKYAGSRFSEDFYYEVSDPLYYDYSNQINKPGMRASWFEANMGMKVRVWKELYLGWAGRIKFAKKVKSSGSSFATYYIPGYGKADEDSRWGFNFQVFYRIPFRDKPPYKPKKVKEITESEEEPPESNDEF